MHRYPFGRFVQSYPVQCQNHFPDRNAGTDDAAYRKTNLLTLPLEQGLALSAIPVIFTSFGFHGSVPSIVNYMGGNIRKLRWVFIIGSAIPLIAYIFWQLATLGAISSHTLSVFWPSKRV